MRLLSCVAARGGYPPPPPDPAFLCLRQRKGGKRKALNADRALGALAESAPAHMANAAHVSDFELSGAKASRVRAALTSEDHVGRAARTDRDGGLPRARPWPAKAKAESRRVNAPNMSPLSCIRSGEPGPLAGRLSGHGFAGQGQRQCESSVATSFRSSLGMVRSCECSRYSGCLSALIGAGRGRALVAMSAHAASADDLRSQPALKRLSFPPFSLAQAKKSGVRGRGWIAPAGCIEVQDGS